MRTSTRITLFYGIFNILSLVILIVIINLVYFFIWYNGEKRECYHEVDMNYSKVGTNNKSDIEKVKSFILMKESVIIEDNGKVVISERLGKNQDLMGAISRDDWFYEDDYSGRVYFVYSNYYDKIGEVRTFFDVTGFVESQKIVTKSSIIVILISIFFYLMVGRMFTKIALRDLMKIVKYTKTLDINKEIKPIHIKGCEKDEIKIVADAINKALAKVKNQTENLKQFISSMAHEFKTPLMVINSEIDLYNAISSKKGFDENLSQKTLDKIKEKVQNLNSMIETLFYVSRLEEGIIIFKKEEIDVTKIIKETSEELKEVYKEKNIEIEYDLIPTLTLHIEETSFRIVVKNLLENAFKYSKEGGKIEVHLCERFFFVKDNGIGISQENLEQIWKNFYREESSGEGFGLGLFLVKKILRLYGYEIEVESSLGEGSKFSINFNN